MQGAKYDLTEDDLFAISSYTYDLGMDFEKEDNFYYVMSKFDN